MPFDLHCAETRHGKAGEAEQGSAYLKPFEWTELPTVEYTSQLGAEDDAASVSDDEVRSPQRASHRQQSVCCHMQSTRCQCQRSRGATAPSALVCASHSSQPWAQPHLSPKRLKVAWWWR
jgi:hypothetical protein